MAVEAPFVGDRGVKENIGRTGSGTVGDDGTGPRGRASVDRGHCEPKRCAILEICFAAWMIHLSRSRKSLARRLPGQEIPRHRIIPGAPSRRADTPRVKRGRDPARCRGTRRLYLSEDRQRIRRERIRRRSVCLGPLCLGLGQIGPVAMRLVEASGMIPIRMVSRSVRLSAWATRSSLVARSWTTLSRLASSEGLEVGELYNNGGEPAIVQGDTHRSAQPGSRGRSAAQYTSRDISAFWSCDLPRQVASSEWRYGHLCRRLFGSYVPTLRLARGSAGLSLARPHSASRLAVYQRQVQFLPVSRLRDDHARALQELCHDQCAMRGHIPHGTGKFDHRFDILDRRPFA